MSKYKTLLEGISERTDKQLRTLRNNLNNRLTALVAEDKMGRKPKELKESHPLYGLGLKDCKDLIEHALKEMKKRKDS